MVGGLKRVVVCSQAPRDDRALVDLDAAEGLAPPLGLPELGELPFSIPEERRGSKVPSVRESAPTTHAPPNLHGGPLGNHQVVRDAGLNDGEDRAALEGLEVFCHGLQVLSTRLVCVEPPPRRVDAAHPISGVHPDFLGRVPSGMGIILW